MKWISVRDMLPGRDHVCVALRLWRPEYQQEEFCLGSLDEESGIELDSTPWLVVPHTDFASMSEGWPCRPEKLFGDEETVEVTHWMPLRFPKD